MTATTPGKPTNRKGSAGAIFTAVYLSAMLLLYVGERLATSNLVRGGLAGLALLGILVAIAGRLQRRKRLPVAARPVEGRLLALYLLGLLALLLYAAQADFVMERLRPMFAEARSADRYQGALTALWPTIWLCAVVPLVMLEISYAPMDVVRTVELDRVRRSMRSGALLAISAALLFVLNFIVNEFDKKVDVSYFKTTRPSESSRKMVQNLSEPVQAVLYFPGTNEVLEQADAYFHELAATSKRFKVRQVDQVMEPGMAKEHGISRNGTVALVRGKQHQQISLGTKLSRAKRKLKRLDEEFQKAFRKLMTQQKVAYLVTGHEERTKQSRGGNRGASIKDLYGWLERLNFAVKDLGIGQGLASEVPADASLVVLAGPRKDLLPAEIESLRRYMLGGGRALLLLDAEAGLDFASLLGPFGLKYTPTPLANDKFYVRLTRTGADRNVLFSNRFSAHPSVTTLTRNSNRVVTIFKGAGALEEIPPTGTNKPRVQFTIHSMPFTWADGDGNRQFNAAKEKRKVYELAAAVTMPLKPAAKTTKKPGAKRPDSELRMIVVADADLVSDALFRNPGNGHFVLDAIKWLTGEEYSMGETSSEEDIRIVHTRKEDQLWFYLTIFAVPALVLFVGLFYTRRIRRRKTA